MTNIGTIHQSGQSPIRSPDFVPLRTWIGVDDAIDVDENWMTPYECAIEKVLRKLQDPEEQEVLHDVITQKEIEKQYRIAMGHQSALYNADKLPGISNL